ncbi:hypothetical protein DL95DRAFT_392515 [Leptodontidium sp. 2 PMI_412]|nr:hypothetical protein DL95DRAFT_392515 [Leptodontidium sp. 2 PMI_412]
MIPCLVSIVLAFLYMTIIMFSRIQRKIFLFITFTFATIGVISVFKYSMTPLVASPSPIGTRQEDNTVFAPDVDIPFDEPPTERVWGLGVWNTIFCYPSVGGFIVNEHITSVELDFLNLSRFEKTPRSSDPDEEDMFCRQLRRTGARWWDSYYSWDLVVVQKSAPMSAKEREALVLGWPEKGGVWVIREHNWGRLGSRGWTWTNAHTMEERCKALEMLGAVYYANPEDCEPVKALLEGFGEHKREPEENYYHDGPADYFREL